MGIVCEFKEGALLVRLAGDFDMAVADNVRTNIDELLDQGTAKTVILDLSGVGFIDSSGLGVVLGRYKRLKAEGGKMAITGAQPQVARILELSGVMKIISCYEEEAEAFRAM